MPRFWLPVRVSCDGDKGSMNLSDIVYENGNHFVLRVAKGYEVYRNEVTTSRRVAAWHVANGLERAIMDCDKREERAA